MGVQNFLFLTTWPKKRAPRKHYKNRGLSLLFFEEKDMRYETAIFGPTKTQIQKFQLSFFFAYFLLFQHQKTQKIAETPFLLCFSKPKKREF